MNFPPVSLELIENTIVQSAGTPLPELNQMGGNSIASPMLGLGHFLLSILLSELGFSIAEYFAILNSLTLG